MPASNGQVDPSGVALATLMAEHTPLLAAILAAVRTDVLEIAIGDVQYRQMVLDQFPVAGAKRVLAYRTGNGFASLPVPTTGVSVLPANEARLGCQFTNSGTNPIVLYLSDQARAGVPCVYLAPSGFTWDGRFGNLAWSGNIFAVALVGASTLVGGEL
jgi:hypothetical protein